MISKTEMAEKIVNTKKYCNCLNCPFDGDECHGRQLSKSICLKVAKDFLSQDWQPLDLEHLPEGIDFKKLPTEQYDVEFYDEQKEKWITLPKNYFEWEDIIKNLRVGVQYRYRQKPKKESVEEAAMRYWKNDKRKDHEILYYSYCDAYVDGFIAGAQWQMEQE